MKKALFVFSCVSVLLGILIVVTASALTELMPLLGRIAFQSAAAGSYTSSDYSISLILPIVTGILMITVGLIFAVKAYKSEKNM